MSSRAAFVPAARVRPWPVLVCAVLLALLPALARSQPPSADPGPWSARTRLQMSGTSDSSEPEGYKVYSGIPIELSIRRALGRRLGVEASASLESREVDVATAGASQRQNLGSLQTLPFTVVAQYYFGGDGARVRPYAGAGAAFTLFWEKSGTLDSTDASPGVGLAVQAGADITLSDSAFFNVDVKWNQCATDVDLAGRRLARLSIDPLTLGIGFGFRF